MGDMEDKEEKPTENQVEPDQSATEACSNENVLNDVKKSLELALENTVKGNKQSSHSDDAFRPGKVPNKKDAKKNIDQYKAECIGEDFSSKLQYRNKTINWVFILLAVQIAFMNIIVAFIYFSQIVPVGWVLKLDGETLRMLVDLAKWYTTAVLVELLAVFCHVVKVVFAAPKFK